VTSTDTKPEKMNMVREAFLQQGLACIDASHSWNKMSLPEIVSAIFDLCNFEKGGIFLPSKERCSPHL
jgi:hypothetical protein